MWSIVRVRFPKAWVSGERRLQSNCPREVVVSLLSNLGLQAGKAASRSSTCSLVQFWSNFMFRTCDCDLEELSAGFRRNGKSPASNSPLDPLLWPMGRQHLTWLTIWTLSLCSEPKSESSVNTKYLPHKWQSHTQACGCFSEPAEAQSIAGSQQSDSVYHSRRLSGYWSAGTCFLPETCSPESLRCRNRGPWWWLDAVAGGFSGQRYRKSGPRSEFLAQI